MRAYINIGQVLMIGVMGVLGYRYLQVLEKQNGIDHRNFTDWAKDMFSAYKKRYKF